MEIASEVWIWWVILLPWGRILWLIQTLSCILSSNSSMNYTASRMMQVWDLYIVNAAVVSCFKCLQVTLKSVTTGNYTKGHKEM